MASFDQISSGFKAFTQQRLNSLEKEVNNTAAYESVIDDLEASLKRGVEEAKQDLNNRIDEFQNAITSRRPHPSDPDYARKQAQYVGLLNESANDLFTLIDMSYGHPGQNYQNGPRPSQHQQGPVHQANGSAGQIQRAPSHSSCAHRAITVVEEQIQTKLPTLILKLQQRASSHRSTGKNHSHHHHHQKLADLADRELDEYLASNLQGFKRELMNNIDNFHQMVLSAKPNPAKQREDPEGYKIHVEQYQELLKLVNELVKRMQESFNDILTRYREHVDQLWAAICQGQDVRHAQRQFEQYMQQNMAHYWKPVFDHADRLIAEIDLNFNQNSARSMPDVKSPR